MKSLLIPLEDDGVQVQLETALLVARGFASHMDGVAPRVIVDAVFYGEGIAPDLQEWEHKEEARIARAQKAFRAFVAAHDIAWGEPSEADERPSADWIADIEGGDAAVGELARLYDLTILAHPVSSASSRRRDLLETVLFESGRPILIAPTATPQTIGRNIVIAWNGSTESARAIAFARPFLERAEEVHVLSVEGGMVAGPNAQQVRQSLRRAGIKADSLVVAPEGRSTGEAILEETTKLGGDLLIKGAYTHSRLRQMIFGGATSHILKEASMSVLMAH